MGQNLQPDPKASQPYSAKSSSNGTLLHMAQETRAGHTKIKRIPSGTHESVLDARRELYVPAVIWHN